MGRSGRGGVRRRGPGAAGRGGERELRRGDPQVVREGPVDERLAVHGAEDPGERGAADRAPDGVLDAQQPAKGVELLVAERGVALQRLLAGLAALDDMAQLASAREAEVERGADPLGGGGQAVTRAVAGEEDAVLDRR